MTVKSFASVFYAYHHTMKHLPVFLLHKIFLKNLKICLQIKILHPKMILIWNYCSGVISKEGHSFQGQNKIVQPRPV